MALCPWKIRLFSRQLIYSPGLDITNYGKTLYKQIHAPKHLEILGHKARAWAWCHFHTNPVVILVRAITVSGFNQLSSHYHQSSKILTYQVSDEQLSQKS